MGPTPTRTPTPTLGMRLSCNFVNVYTTDYRVQYTTRASLTDILARKIAPRVSDKSARILVRVRLVDDPRAEVGGEEVRVGVGVVECRLKK